MANLSIKIQGFSSWEEGKFSVEKEDFDKLLTNVDETYPSPKSFNYYGEGQINCMLTIPWELYSLFYDLEDAEKKLDKIAEESNSSTASKIITAQSEFKSTPIPKLFDEIELEAFPYWMYQYNTSDRKKTGRSVMERNENTVNPNILLSFIIRVEERVVPLNLFTKQEKVVSFINRAKEFCEFAKKYHIRISIES